MTLSIYTQLLTIFSKLEKLQELYTTLSIYFKNYFVTIFTTIAESYNNARIRNIILRSSTILKNLRLSQFKSNF